MQTIRLRFSTNLKNATLRRDGDSSPDLIAADPEGNDGKPKLTKTQSDSDATSLLLVKQELTNFLAVIEQHVHHQNARYDLTIGQFRELAVQVAMKIAAAVVRYEVSEHDTRIRRLLQDLFAQQESPSPLVVYVNKVDLERLKISHPDAPSLDSTLFQLKADNSLAPGDVRIESPENRLLASCQQQLAGIESQLMEYLCDARPNPSNLEQSH